jgi:hypothetical protein
MAPYQLVNIYIRGNIGETLAFAILPWVLVFSDDFIKLNKNKAKFVISFATFLLAHNLIAVLSIPLIMLVTLTQNNVKNIKKIIYPSFISVLLVSFFWIPALAEKKYIVLDKSPLSNKTLENHFVTIDQLFFSKWEYGYSQIGPVDNLNYSLGFAAIAMLLFLLPSLLVDKKSKKYEIIICAVFLISIFLMLSLSAWVYDRIPQLSIIQFPWRFLFFTTFAGSILVAYVSQNLSKKTLAICIACSVFFYTQTHLATNFNTYSNEQWFTFPLNTTILNENDPIWLDRNKAYEYISNSQDMVICDTCQVKINKWNGSFHQYEIAATQSAIIVEKTMFFPGWETKVNNKKIDNLETIKENAGLISYTIDPGEYQITTKFTQKTPARYVGNILSLIGMLLLIKVIRNEMVKK